jgi:hypothetical protein
MIRFPTNPGQVVLLDLFIGVSSLNGGGQNYVEVSP